MANNKDKRVNNNGQIDKAVERLQEYRADFITAAVTGKIDVRAHSKSTPLTP